MSLSKNPRILFEDQEILVCHKPSGVPAQTNRIGTPDLVSILKNHLRKESRSPYLALIHRLDQPVEGLMVFAKTPRSAKELSRQLTTSGFGKYYLAVAVGVPSEAEADLTDYLVKDARSNTSHICSKDTPQAKIAKLHYKVLAAGTTADGSSCSLLKIHLDTGRHHQIRVQMAHMGHPLIGDRKYNLTGTSSPKLLLCAFRLSFRHPVTGKKMEFTLPVPEEYPLSSGKVL